MPGVPSGKGCGQCRRQKKKCDQLTPSCSRCARLGLACIGAGERRYKFVYGHSSSSSSSNSSNGGDRGDKLARMSSSDTTLLALSLAEKFAEHVDLSLHLSWTYGDFLEDIPRRIGANPALDASVAALVSAHSHASSLPSTRTPVETLGRYSQALASLRAALSDQAVARQPETLCACYLLLITQGFLDSSSSSSYLGSDLDMPLTHTQGATKILKARGCLHNEAVSGYNDDDHQFEQNILLSLKGPVLLEALWNDEIDFTPAEWARLVESRAQATTFVDQMMKCWARLPDLLRQGRLALQQQQQQQQHLLPDLIQQAREVYALFLRCVNVHRRRYSLFKADPVLYTLPGLSVERMAHIYHRIYTLSLGLCLVASSVVQGLEGRGRRHHLQTEADLLCQEVLLLADQGAVYRPIGAGHMLACLPLAWSATLDAGIRAKLLQQYSLYASGDLPSGRSGSTSTSCPEAVERRLRRSSQQLRAGSDCAMLNATFWPCKGHPLT